MNPEEIYYQNHNASMCVPLKKTEKDFVFMPEAKESEVMIFWFSDYNLFLKYINSDFIDELADKCNADFLGQYESETLQPHILPTAIKIVSKAINQKKNANIKEYLVKTKEFMEQAISLDTFIQFNF